MTDDDSALGKQPVHHPQAEREAEVEPNRMADHLSQKALAGVAGNGGRYLPAQLTGSVPSQKSASPQG